MSESFFARFMASAPSLLAVHTAGQLCLVGGKLHARVKLALITTIVLSFGNVLALGLEVDKKIEAPVWCETKRIRGSSSFCGV